MFKFLSRIFKSKKKKPHLKLVKTKSGLNVELLADQPDGLAEMMEECLTSGKVMTGTVDKDGNFSYKKEED